MGHPDREYVSETFGPRFSELSKQIPHTRLVRIGANACYDAPAAKLYEKRRFMKSDACWPATLEGNASAACIRQRESLET
jgi:hypothetical protein